MKNAFNMSWETEDLASFRKLSYTDLKEWNGKLLKANDNQEN
jgi:hypothetical protein